MRQLNPVAAAALVLAVVSLDGCTVLIDPGPTARIVSPAEFVRPGAVVLKRVGEPREVPAPTSAPPEAHEQESSEAPSVTGHRLVAGPPGPPPKPDRPAARVGDRVLVDSMVGQVNGRPIFADVFFEPIADELQRAAERFDQKGFTDEVRRIVNGRVMQVVQNELILAAAEASLTIEQQKGVFAWIRQMQGEVIRQKGRSRAEAESSLLAEKGQTLDEYLEAEKDLMLVHQLLQQKIRPRVIVSWREVELEYERLYRKYNAPATMTVARISLNRELQPEVIAEVTERLGRGDPFEQVALDAGMPPDRGDLVFELNDDGSPQLENETVRRLLGRLEAGQTSPPVSLRQSTVWFHVVSIDPARSRSLYEPNVQREIVVDLDNRRLNAEHLRYMRSLLEKGIYDEIDEMTERLRQIAVQRYGR